MNRKQLDEVQRALQQMSIVRTQEEERLRLEYRKEDKELRDVRISSLPIPTMQPSLSQDCFVYFHF